MHISVIIPAYNEEKHIAGVLESLLKQTQKPDEVVVINNNSLDNTGRIARSYIPKGVRIIDEHTQGLAMARDRGFREAKGDVVCRTDADSIIPPNWVATIADFFQTHPDTLAISGPIVYTEQPLRFFGTTPSLLYEWLVRLRLGHSILIGPNMALRKMVVEKITPCSTRLDIHEDVDLSQHIAKLGKIQFISSLQIETSGRRILRSPLGFITKYSRMLGNNIAHKVEN